MLRRDAGMLRWLVVAVVSPAYGWVDTLPSGRGLLTALYVVIVGAWDRLLSCNTTNTSNNLNASYLHLIEGINVFNYKIILLTEL